MNCLRLVMMGKYCNLLWSGRMSLVVSMKERKLPLFLKQNDLCYLFKAVKSIYGGSSQ